MKYKLLVEKTNGSWGQADLGNEDFPMNYQSNDIAEMQDRQADYSQSLKLPKTLHNLALFDYPEFVDTTSTTPYKRLNCMLYCNEFTIAGKGSYLIIDDITDYIECQILSGNADLFEKLKDTLVANIPLGYIIRGYDSMLPKHFTPTYSFVVATYRKNGESRIEPHYETSYPVINMHNLITSIMYHVGFMIITDVPRPELLNTAISLASIDITEDDLKTYGAYAESKDRVQKDGYLAWGIDADANGYLNKNNTNGNLLYRSPADCDVVIKFTMNNVQQIQDLNNKILIKDYATNETLFTEISLNKFVQVKLSLEKDQKIEISRQFTRSNGGYVDPTYFATVTFDPPNITEVPVGGKLHFAPNLGFKTCLDFFKAFVQLYGLTVSVDNNKKVVHANTINKIYENIPYAKDWSNKLDCNKAKHGFRLTQYSRRNTISMKEDTSLNINDEGFFCINDEGLEGSKNIFSLPFEAGEDKYRKISSDEGYPIANIPLYEVEFLDDGTVKRKFKKGKPHLLKISEFTVSIGLNGSGDGWLTAVDYKIATHARVQYYIDTYYDKLYNRMLRKAKILEAVLNLDERDIHEFYSYTNGVSNYNTFIPIYLKQYGAYFYINKIKNFISGKLTTCELIKL